MLIESGATETGVEKQLRNCLAVILEIFDHHLFRFRVLALLTVLLLGVFHLSPSAVVQEVFTAMGCAGSKAAAEVSKRSCSHSSASCALHCFPVYNHG